MSIQSIGENLLQASIAKDEAKIRRKVEENAKRTERFLSSAKQRTVGVDVDALDAQVAEVQGNRQKLIESDRYEKLRQQQIERIYESAAQQEKEMRDQQMQQLKKSWEESISSKRNNSAPSVLDFDRDRSGKSSVQIMDGEDVTKNERTIAQKNQMRQWIQEQIAEKAYRAEMEARDNTARHQQMVIIDQMREAAEEEDKKLRRSNRLQINSHNEQIRLKKVEDSSQQLAQWEEQSLEEKLSLTSLDLFNEDPSAAMGDSGRIVRKDMFKGYTEAQKRRIFQENDAHAQVKRERELAEKQRQRDWDMQQILLSRAMEQAHFEDRQRQQETRMEHARTLRQQAEEQSQKKEIMRKEKFGKIEPGFHSNFGRSCR